MKHNCENVSIRRSESNVIEIIYSIISTYYKSIGYGTYAKSYEFGILIGEIKKGNAIHDFLFGPKRIDHAHVIVYTSDNYRIQATYTSTEMLDKVGELCKALNDNMPDDIIWELEIINDTSE